ncbi:MFS family permease [Bradyrhizobium sp. LM6.10]
MVFNLCQAFGFYGFANPIAPLLASSFADRFERRWIIAGACAAIIIFGMAFAPLTEPSLLIICGVLLTACNTTMSYAYHAYQTRCSRPGSGRVPPASSIR